MTAAERKKRQLIVMDLEMNPVPKETAPRIAREVIEIGAVRICNNEIADNFHTYVKPTLGNTVSPIIRRLTGIHDGNLRNAPCFKQAIMEFSEWIGTERDATICAWSDSDRRQLMEESHAKAFELPENISAFEDVQRMHYEKLGSDITRKQMALCKAASQYGITMSRKESHSALYDARITADILILLETGRFQKQAALLKKVARERMESPTSGFLIGDLCKGVFEQMNVQAVRA